MKLTSTSFLRGCTIPPQTHRSLDRSEHTTSIGVIALPALSEAKEHAKTTPADTPESAEIGHQKI